MKASVIWIMVGLMASAGCYEPPESGELSGQFRQEVLRPEGLTLRLTPADLPPGRTQIRFGVAPFLGSETATKGFKPVAEYLTNVLGYPVTLVVGESYQNLIDQVVANQLDIVILPPASYVLAKQRSPGLRLLASQIAYGSTTYSSYLIVRADDAAQSLVDLVGRRIAFVDTRSTSGYLFPAVSFLDVGIDPGQAFEEVVFAGAHSDAIRLLASRKVDVAATASGMLDMTRRHSQKGKQLDPGGIRILHKSGRIPYDALCASGEMPASGALKVAWAFIGLSTRTAPGRRAYAQTYQISGWIPAKDSLYDGVRHVVERVRTYQNSRETK